MALHDHSAANLAAAQLLLSGKFPMATNLPLGSIADSFQNQQQRHFLLQQLSAMVNNTAMNLSTNDKKNNSLLVDQPGTDSIHSHSSSSSSPSSGQQSRASSVVSMNTNGSGNTNNAASVLFHTHPHKERKRRRMIGNMDNTLDGLVAKRAELDPRLEKRYQTEGEAIELPDDEAEIKRLETDPDVSTRMCSVCGYQGKWVSEMIRHKRVHTNERPFKCKYCNRTSKWKADLIRHVAKTHGIRVVSKYSRSKAFDGASPDIPSTGCKSMIGESSQDENNNKMSVIHKAISRGQNFDDVHNFGPITSAPVFRCLTCNFEEEMLEVLISHLRNVHNLSPFECGNCKQTFEDMHSASAHCSLLSVAGGCTPLSIKVNLRPVYNSSDKLPGFGMLRTNNSNNNGLLCLSTSSNASPPLSIRSTSEMDSSMSSVASNTNTSITTSSSGNDNELDNGSDLVIQIDDDGCEETKFCKICPFKTESLGEMQSHNVGHKTPLGVINYKCTFCHWHAKNRYSMESHLTLHTDHPEKCIAQTEELAAKSVLFNGFPSEQSNSAFSVPPSNIVQMENVPGLNSRAEVEQSENMKITAQQQLALFSMLCANNVATSQQNQATMLPHSIMASMLPAHSTQPVLSNLLQQVSSNPVLAFGLCSLLEERQRKFADLMNNTKFDQVI
ncbi:c2H2-type zinc-finger domain-containing protein [Ditylenchus destructor]|nr:c2H2-type zinc-finger domain-containing protein [Ditylenchus destructor]